MTEGERKCFFRSSSVLLTITIICYAIVMGVGWVLAIREEPGQPLILAGAIVSTIPILSLVSYLCFAFTFRESCEDGSCIKFSILTIQLCAGLVQIIGAALFIAIYIYSERTKRSCLWSVCWCVWYDWWMLLYLFSVLLFCLHVWRSRSNIRLHFLILYTLFFHFLNSHYCLLLMCVEVQMQHTNT